MIKCPECGELINDELSSCSNCGYPFDGTEERVEDKPIGDTLIEDKPISEMDTELSNDIVESSDEMIETEEVHEETVHEEDLIENSLDEKIEEDEKVETASEVTPEEVQPDSKESKKSSNMKKKVAYVGVGLIVLCLLVGNINYMNKYKKCNSEYNDLQKKYKSLQADYDIQKLELKKAGSQNDELSDQISTLTAENDELKNGAKKQLNDVKNSYEKGDWSKVIELANTLHSKYNGSDEDKEAQKLATESQKKIDEANAAKEAEKAKGYETGITYDQLARTPDDFDGKKVKFSGKVVQVIEDDDTTQIRLAVNDNYDTVLFGEYSKSIVSSRVLEDDHITIYGTSVGTISYKSTMGGTITIPGVYIEKIDQ